VGDDVTTAAKKTVSSIGQRRENQSERFNRIYKAIRERICLLDYHPGTLLNEGLLAEEFGVSRTPVRNVLQRLGHEGLVETRNGIGTIVTDLDLKAFKEVYELRMRLSEMTGDLSPIAPTTEILKDIKTLQDRVEILKDGPVDQRAYALLCNDLHELLLGLIGNQALRDMTDFLYYRAARIWFTFLHNLDWNEAVGILGHEISEIQRALEVGDMHGVGNARRQYLYMTLKGIGRYFVNV
jgi:DNA-binding GntR family transcriptional regulator|tara:strand:+ start:3258 stop:3974 length:717 start_codon:yes stop_codon:yes gene_type:complete